MTQAAAMVAACLLALALAGCSERLSGIVDLTVVDEPRAGPIDPASVTFKFTPFRNIPGNVADDFTRFLVRESRAEGLVVLRRPDADADYTIVSVASAVSDDTNSTVFYVFDIFGPGDERLHRIRGQQASTASRGDPWAGVSNEDLRIVAARVAIQIRAWLSAARS